MTRAGVECYYYNMKKMGRFFRDKKGFTLVELLAVMAIMAIATALILPNIQGMIDKTEESKIKNYCVEATTNLQGYMGMLLIGNDKVPYQDKKGDMQYYTIKDNVQGLQNALNEYNLNGAYQYYVLPYVTSSDTSSAKSDPSSTVKSEIINKKLAAKDTMVTCVEKTTSVTNTRTEIYKIVGFWFYSYAQNKVVYTYYVPTKRCGQGFTKLTSDGK